MYHHHRVVFRVYKAWASSDICRLCVVFHVVCSFDISRSVPHGLWVPQNTTVTATNGLCHDKLCTARCALGVFIGVQHHDAEYTAQIMAATSYIKSATGRTLHYTRYANMRLEIHYDALCKSATGITRHYPLVLKSVTGNKRHHTWYGKMLPVYIQTIEKKPP